jgi:hypothetical protein
VAKRKALSKKVRFEVFKRDSFKCQYCGHSAPDVVLEVDHIHPVAGGGTNDITNLVTACDSCNGGKSATPLSDDAAVKKSKAQLDQLQARREQIEMMAEWQRGLVDLGELALRAFADLWAGLAVGWHINEAGRATARKWIQQFGVAEVLESARIAGAAYLKFEDGRATQESVTNAFGKIGGVCVTRQRERDCPDIRRLYYIRAILRRRMEEGSKYFDSREALTLMQDALKRGVTLHQIERAAKDAWSMYRFEAQLDEEGTNA